MKQRSLKIVVMYFARSPWYFRRNWSLTWYNGIFASRLQILSGLRFKAWLFFWSFRGGFIQYKTKSAQNRISCSFHIYALQIIQHSDMKFLLQKNVCTACNLLPLYLMTWVSVKNLYLTMQRKVSKAFPGRLLSQKCEYYVAKGGYSKAILTCVKVQVIECNW